MAKITLDDILSQFASTAALNNRFQQIEDELNNKVLYRDNPDGEPNAMESDLDMNNQRIINLPAGVLDGEAVNVAQLEVHDLLIQGYVADAEAAKDAAETAATNAAASEANAATSANNAAASAAAAAVSESNAAASADIAQDIATALSNTFSYYGEWDASSGTAPPTPVEPGQNPLYLISVAGTILAIEYGVGDSIFWTGSAWAKLDTADAITSVNGDIGEVEVSELRVGGVTRAIAGASGDLSVRSNGNTDSESRSLNFTHQSGTTRASIGHFAASTLRVRNQINSGAVQIEGNSSGGVARVILQANPDGSASIYYAGNLALSTISSGVSVISPSDNNPILNLFQDDAVTRGAYIQAHSINGLLIKSDINGLPVTITADDAGGTQQNVFYADPDGEVSEYYNGTKRTSTGATGQLRLHSDGNTDTEVRRLRFDHQDGTQRGYVGYAGNSDLFLFNNVHGASVVIGGEDAGGNARDILNGDPDGETSLWYNGNKKIATTSTGIDVTGSITTNGSPLAVSSYAYKTGTTSRSSTTTLDDDPDLSVTISETGFYEVELFLKETTGGAGGGIKLAINFGGTATGSFFADMAGVAAAVHIAALTSVSGTNVGGTSDAGYIWVVGFVDVTATTSNVLTLRWAQQSSNANATSLLAGSWLKVTRMGDT